MSESRKMNRRDAIKCSAVAGVAAVAGGGCAEKTDDPEKPVTVFKNPGNGALYLKDGAFDPAAVKKAYSVTIAPWAPARWKCHDSGSSRV